MESNILSINNRAEFRAWLEKHSKSEKECWLVLKRGKPTDPTLFYYLDAVEEALCFGWIDSTVKLINGQRMQRFSPRKENGLWTELNKERVRRLERMGLMTDEGRAVFPKTDVFRMDTDIESALKKARCFSRFRSFPPLYQRVKAYNLSFYKKRDPDAYQRMLNHLIKETKKGNLFGEWNDYGRLTDDR